MCRGAQLDQHGGADDPARRGLGQSQGVACDGAVAFQPIKPRLYGGARHPQFAGEFGHGQPCVGAERCEDFAV